MLGKVLGPKTEVTREWRRLHKEELRDVYSLPNTLHVIKPRRMRWRGGMWRVGREERCIQGFGE